MNNQLLDYSFSLNYSQCQEEFSYNEFNDQSYLSTNEKYKLKPLQKLQSKKPEFIALNDYDQKVQQIKHTQSERNLQLDYISNKIDRQKFNQFQIKLDINALNGMQNENEMKVWDTNKHQYNDKHADQELYKYYKNIDRVVEQNLVTNLPVQSSAYTAMLQKMKNLYPRKLGIIKPNGNLKKIELNNLETSTWQLYQWEVNVFQIQNLFVYLTIEYLKEELQTLSLILIKILKQLIFQIIIQEKQDVKLSNNSFLKEASLSLQLKIGIIISFQQCFRRQKYINFIRRHNCKQNIDKN